MLVVSPWRILYIGHLQKPLFSEHGVPSADTGQRYRNSKNERKYCSKIQWNRNKGKAMQFVCIWYSQKHPNMLWLSLGLCLPRYGRNMTSACPVVASVAGVILHRSALFWWPSEESEWQSCEGKAIRITKGGGNTKRRNRVQASVKVFVLIVFDFC